MAASLDVIAFEGAGPLEPLFPASSGDTVPFFSALARGEFALQRCGGCERARYPVAPVCPYCLSAVFEWDDVPGSGEIHSWVRYHRSYLPAFEKLVPYVVLTVRLDAGPFIFGRLLGRGEPVLGRRVGMLLEEWADGRRFPAFELTEGPT